MNVHQNIASAWGFLGTTPLLWLTLTFLAYAIAQVVHGSVGKSALANPVLIAVALLILALRESNTSYVTYMQSAQPIQFLLGPAIVALAIPMHRQLPKLRRLAPQLAGALVAGCATGISSAVLIPRLLGATGQILATIAPKSVTAGIAIRISEKIGGLPSLTAVLVIMTGITGAVIGSGLLRLIHVSRHDLGGFALGVASHGIGTARALQISEEAGAFAGLGMGLNGILTSFVLPIIYPILSGFS